MAYNNGLLSLTYGLFWGIVACFVGLLGVPGTCFPGSLQLQAILASSL